MKTSPVVSKSTNIFFITLLLLVGTATPNILAQGPDEPEMQFDHAFDLGVQALPHMHQDNDGFLWIASRGGGLYRYDGYELKNYAPGPDGLTNGDIRGIIEDPENPDILWVGTLGGGLNRFDKATETFTSFQHLPNDPTSLIDNSIWYMIQDGNDPDILWLITYAGIEKFDRKTGTAAHYKITENSPYAPHAGIWRFIEDYQDPTVLWIAYWGDGFDKFNKTTQIFTHYTHDSDDADSLGAEDNVVTAIAQDKDDPNIIWLGTAKNGLDRFDKATGTFSHYAPNQDDPDSIRQGMIALIYDDGQGRLWLGGWGEPTGLTLFDKKIATFSQYNHDPGAPQSLSNDLVNNVYEDRSGIFWITTFPGQIDKYDPHTHNFALFQKNPNPDSPTGLSNNVVVSIYQDRQNQIWIGTQGGLDRFDRASGTFTHYKHIPDDPDSLDGDYIQNTFEDSAGTFWVSLFIGPLVVFDRESGKVIKRYSPIGDGVDSYTQVIEDPDNSNILWMGTRGGSGGLVRFDKASEDLTFYKNDPDNPEKGPASESVYLVFHDAHEDVIWLGSEFGGGLSRFDKKSETFTHYTHNPDNPDSISSGAVVSIYQDSADILWLGTKGGSLEKFNKQTQTFTHYSQEHGIPPNVNKILQDDHGLFWLSTSNGILRFNPATETVEQQYLEVDGLQGDAFFFGSGVKTRDGQMWFGGTNGANSFHPDRLVTNAYVPPVILTSLTQGGEPLNPDAVPGRLEHIRLDWQHNYFEFEYAALNYTIPEKNQYRYMLEGFDREWYEAGTRRFGRYSGLPGGDYTLRVIGSNNDGVWNEQGVSLTITILPPWWETTWFRGLAIALVVGLVSGAFVWQRQSAKRRERQLETQVAERTYELKIAKDEAEAAKEKAQVANQAKSTFLAQMSHELRTPLNAILGYADILKRRTDHTGPLTDGLNIIHQSGEHLLTLINDVLDLAKIEANKLDLTPAPVHLPTFLRQIVGIIRARAEAKDLSLSYESLSLLPASVLADEKRLRQVLLNLLGNAVKFTDRGRVALTVEALDDARAGEAEVVLRFRVEDTGVGIAPEQLERIFQPFEQAGEADKRAEGTGLGLAISQQIVQRMGGRLQVQSEFGQGSAFWFDVTLPLTEVAAREEPIPVRKVVGYEGARRVVLVADDRQYNRLLLVDMLEPLGFEVHTVGDGQQAVEVALELQPDAIVIDLVMPVKTGFEAVREIRRRPDLKEVFIVAASASVLEADQEKSLVVGCDAFVPKPVKAERLLDLLATHLELSWVYAELAVEVEAIAGPLIPPPAEELAALHKLARSGRILDIREQAIRLAKMDEAYIPFARKLQALAKRFEIEQIKALVEQFIKEK